MEQEPVNEEIWKDVEGFPNYQISNQGRLYNKKSKRYNKGHQRPDGYVRVKLPQKNVLLHRLVAEHFIPNPEDRPEVYHLGDKYDNRANMLRWGNRKETCQYSADFKLNFRSVPINRMNPETGEILETYSSITEASKQGYRITCISLCINGKVQTHKEFSWSRVHPIKKEEDPKDEEWRDLKDSVYGEANTFVKYKVSNYGRIKGWFDNLLVPNTNSKYNSIKLTREEDGFVKSAKIHRLVVMAFNVPNAENKKEVDHIDSNPRNNHLSNLRWATRKEQAQNLATKKKFMKKV